MPKRSDIEAMTRDEKSRLACTLSRYPALRSDEIARFIGISRQTLKDYIKHGRSVGEKSGFDLYGTHAPTEPSAQEMRWRFENQSAAEIIERFGTDELTTYLRELRIENETPQTLMRMLRGTDYSARPNPKDNSEVPLDVSLTERIGPKTKAVRIRDSDVVIEYADNEELALINDIVQSIYNSYEVAGADWRRVLPVIEIHRDLHRYKNSSDDQTIKDLTERANAIAKIGELFSKMGLEAKHGESASQLFQQAVRSAPEYLAERGYRQTVACPDCGSLIPVYYILYRACVQLLELAQRAYDDKLMHTTTATVLRDEMRKILEFSVEHPFLQKQLRDLGVAWSKPVVDWAEQFVARHPEMLDQYVDNGATEAEAEDLFWVEMTELLGAMFEVGPVCFDQSLPFSPINRVVTDEHGKLAVVTPDD